MMDSVSILWGWQRGRRTLLIENPESGRKVDGPDDLDLRRWVDVASIGVKLGVDDGQVQSKRYAWGIGHYGHWQLEYAGATVDVMVREGRLELRASLPKLIHGRNDVVLTETETRWALEILAQLARDLTGCDLLTLENGRISRADYCHQWLVPSVRAILTALRLAWAPPRKMVATFETRGPQGGASLVFGYGGPTVFRFYDKCAERAASGELVPDAQIDRILRYEVQERRPVALDSTRADAFNGRAMLKELRHPFDDLAPIVAARALSDARTPRERRELGLALWLSENPGELAALRHDPTVSESEWHRVNRATRRAAALALGEWRPTFPDDLPDTGMAPHRLPEFAHTYPTAEEIAAAEQAADEKRARIVAKARAEHAALVRKQTVEPDPLVLERERRARGYARTRAANDQLVAELRREREAAASTAYASLLAEEQSQARRQLRLELGEYLARAKGTLAREIARGAMPAAAMPWN